MDEDTRKAQVALRALGYPPGPIDGIEGPLTRAAYRAYARHHMDQPMATRTEVRSHLNVSHAAMGQLPQPRTDGGGCGAFLWQAGKMTPADTIALARELGLSRIYPKVMNKRGRAMYKKTMQALVPALQAAGFDVYPWYFGDDTNAKRDAENFAEICLQLGCTKGGIANMEREVVDGRNKPQRQHDARAMDDALTVLGQAFSDYVGFSSFRRRDYFPYPRDVFQKHAATGKVVFMPQCYNLKTTTQSEKRVTSSSQSWLKWGLPVRMTLGLFPAKSSSSKKFGSRPEGIVAGGNKVRALAASNAKLDSDFDWWVLEQARRGYADPTFRAAVTTANTSE